MSTPAPTQLSPVLLSPVQLNPIDVASSGPWRPELELGLLFVGGLLLLFTLYLFGRLSALLPMRKQRRELWRRAQPIIALLVSLTYLTFAIRVVLRQTVNAQVAGVLGLALALGAAFWYSIRDVVSGVLLKAGRVCRVGDLVRIGEHEGRIDSMGLRSLTIETRRGEEAVIPYSRLTRDAVLRTPIIEGSVLYVFRVKAQGDASVPEVRRTIIERAVCSHWSSVVREPQVKALGNSEFEVTVFALHADYGPEIEALVNRASLFNLGAS